MGTMENRNTCGYFKQDNKTDSIEYGKEHTGDNVCYSGNKLLRKKDISGQLSKFRSEEEPLDIRTTEIQNKNSLLYESLGYHEHRQSSAEIQDKVTQQKIQFINAIT